MWKKTRKTADLEKEPIAKTLFPLVSLGLAESNHYRLRFFLILKQLITLQAILNQTFLKNIQ